MTREAFIAKHLDEMVGLLLAAFAVEQDDKPRERPVFKDAERGRFMIATMQRARAFLGRMYDDLNKEKKP